MKRKFDTDHIMGQMEYKKALWKLALPSIATFLVMSMYLTIDRLLISRYVSPLAMGSLQYVVPIMNLASSLTLVVGVGAKIHFSILLGKKKHNDIKQLISNAAWLMGVCGLFLAFTLYFFGGKIPVLLGAKPFLAQMASKYIVVLSAGVFFQSIIFLYESFFEAKGYTKAILFFTLVCQLTNLCLDVYFMKYLNLGISGAAYATVCSIYLNFILFLLYIFFIRKEFLINIFKYKMSKAITKSVFYQGAPVAIQTWILSLKMIIFVFLFTKLANQNEIIIYTAARTIMNLLMIPAFGMVSAASPMIGYNFGSKNYNRLTLIAKYKLKSTMIYLLLASIVIWIFPAQLLNIFNSGTLPNATSIIRIITLAIWLLAYPIVWGSLLKSLGYTHYTSKLYFLRSVIVYIPVIFIAYQFKTTTALFWALPLSDVIGFIATRLYIIYIIKKEKDSHLKMFIK